MNSPLGRDGLEGIFLVWTIIKCIYIVKLLVFCIAPLKLVNKLGASSKV